MKEASLYHHWEPGTFLIEAYRKTVGQIRRVNILLCHALAGDISLHTGEPPHNPEVSEGVGRTKGGSLRSLLTFKKKRALDGP